MARTMASIVLSKPSRLAVKGEEDDVNVVAAKKVCKRKKMP